MCVCVCVCGVCVCVCVYSIQNRCYYHSALLPVDIPFDHPSLANTCLRIYRTWFFECPNIILLLSLFQFPNEMLAVVNADSKCGRK